MKIAVALGKKASSESGAQSGVRRTAVNRKAALEKQAKKCIRRERGAKRMNPDMIAKRDR